MDKKTTEVVKAPSQEVETMKETIGGVSKSTSIKNLAIALVKFQGEVENVAKDGDNPFFRSKYATLENIVSQIRPYLFRQGLAFSQFPSGESELTTILLHTSGEFLCSTVKMAPKDNTPQGQGSAITYMRRYALSAVLGIVTEEDDDGNAASQTPKNRTSKPTPKTSEPVPVIDYDQENSPITTPDEAETVEYNQEKAKGTNLVEECSVCRNPITKAEYNFSMDRYGRPLCRPHQAEAKKNK